MNPARTEILTHYTALKVAHCGSVDCSMSSTIALDVGAGSGYGRGSSIAIGMDGLPIVSYFDTKFLIGAHCGNRFCVLNHRPG